MILINAFCSTWISGELRKVTSLSSAEDRSHKPWPQGHSLTGIHKSKLIPANVTKGFCKWKIKFTNICHLNRPDFIKCTNAYLIVQATSTVAPNHNSPPLNIHTILESSSQESQRISISLFFSSLSPTRVGSKLLWCEWWWWFSRSVVSDSCNPMDCSLPGSSVHGILQARMEWVAISFSKGSFRTKNQTQVSCIAGRLFTN